MNASEPVGVIFDMDGVLVDSAKAHLQSWQRLAAELDRAVDREQFAATFGRQNRDIIPAFFGDVSRARLSELANRKEELYREIVREDMPIIHGAVELLRGLHEVGARLAVGSSGPRANIDLVLATMNATDLVAMIVSGDDVTRGKPDPQVFSLCADRLGLEPRQCVVVEDAPVGIEAARRAGARAVAVLTYHPAEAFARLAADCQPDMVATRLNDLFVAQLVSLVG